MQALSDMSNRKITRQTSTDIVSTGIALAGATLLLGIVAATAFDLGADYVWRAVLGFCLVAAAVWWLASKTLELDAFGPANRITLLRVALVALVAAAIGEAPNDLMSWSIVVTVTVALILDGFDGRAARRTNTVSAFGARFDMETDAALIMILSTLCWQFGKAGIWILAAGAMRYCFVLASKIFAWMREPLPASSRRQAVCIWQSALLLGVISPLFPVPASQMLAAGTLLMLGTSFAIDVHWLWAQRRIPGLASHQ